MDQKIRDIIDLSEAQIADDEIKKGLLTYKQLQFLLPKEKVYYVNYIIYLEDEFVIAELLWSAYVETVECCNRAIANLPIEDHFYFHFKKLELFIHMADSNFEWYKSNQEEVQHYTAYLLQTYAGNFEVLKRIMALYRVTGHNIEEEKLLDEVYNLNPDDFTILISKLVKHEKKEEYSMAAQILEKWIKANKSVDFYTEIAYEKIIDLYTKLHNNEKADHYQDLLDNL